MPYPRLNNTVLYRVERKKVHYGATGLSDRIAEMINKGIFNSHINPDRTRDSLLLDILEQYPQAQFAYTEPLQCMEAIKDPDVLDKFGFCLAEVETRPLIVENNHALYLDHPGTILSKAEVEFNTFKSEDVKHYSRFPHRIIVPTTEAIDGFRRALPHLHRPHELANNLLLSIMPTLMHQKSAPEGIVSELENYYLDDEIIQQELSEASRKYSLEEFSTAFLDLCENIFNHLANLGAYEKEGLFPYEVDCDGREILPGGILVKRVSFGDFQYLKGYK